MSTVQANTDFGNTVDRLIDLSISTYYNPYTHFEWPASLDEEQMWMSPDLMTAFDTPFIERLSRSQLMKLSKWESINFYSLNIHGIRELLIEVIRRIHSPGYEEQSEFFHHFIGEENEHMWFFARFCLKYGKKIYADKTAKTDIDNLEPDLQTFLVFSRIVIFEEIVDYFNSRMGKDDTLHPLIQRINSVHHQDESRHVAFGRQLIKQLHARLSDTYPKERMMELAGYLRRYIEVSLNSLYNPAVYKDAGIEEPYQFRRALLEHPNRKKHHDIFLKRTMQFLDKSGIVPEETL